MLWIKVPSTTALVVTLYTSDEDIAKQFEMKKKSKGKFYYKNFRAKPILRHLGFVKGGNRGEYMKMMHKCPPVSDLIKTNQKVPLELKEQMEAFFEWDKENKTFNYDKEWPNGQA